MAISRTRKSEIVSSLSEKLKTVKSAFFIDYTGMTVKETQSLKRALSKVGSEYIVSKKNLLDTAFKNNEVSDFTSKSSNKGGLAIILNNDDEVSGIKEFYKFNKESSKKAQKSYPVLGGYYEGKIVATEDIDQLSNVLSKEEFISKFMYILNSSASSLARAINAIAEQKQAGEPAKATEEVKEEAKEEAAPAAEATAESTETPAEAPVETPAETTEAAPAAEENATPAESTEAAA